MFQVGDTIKTIVSDDNIRLLTQYTDFFQYFPNSVFVVCRKWEVEDMRYMILPAKSYTPYSLFYGGFMNIAFPESVMCQCFGLAETCSRER